MVQVFKRIAPWLGLSLLVLGCPAMAQSAADSATVQAADPDSSAEQSVDEATDQAVAEAEGFPPDQIEQLVAPVALYPDALLAQLLMASTYPLDIVQASRWVEDNADLDGQALQDAVVEQRWDPSVQALAFFPTVLQYMNENLDWTQDLGEAFLGQQDEVMESVQTLRQEAQEAGNLTDNEQQQVLVEGDTIVVQPAEPEVVYVPSYDPSEVYNQPPPQQTYYPTTYTQPVQPVAVDDGSSDLVTFGVGALAGGLLTAAIMWDDDDDDYRGVYYGGPGRYGGPSYWSSPGYRNGGYRNAANISRDVNIQTGDINVNRGISGNTGKWEHNSEHRGNIRYKNEKTKARYSGDRKRTSVDREVARGRQQGGPRGGAAKQPSQKLSATKRPKQQPNLKQASRKTPASGKRTAASKPNKRNVDLKRPPNSAPKARAPAAKAPKPKSAAVAKAPRKKPKASAGAFKKSSGSLDRAASKRGAKSVKRSGHSGGGRKARSRRG